MSKKTKTAACSHKNVKMLVRGEYESGASTGYLVAPGLYWCKACGAYAWEEPGLTEMTWTKPKAQKK